MHNSADVSVSTVEERVDPDSGYPYYHDSAAGISGWTREELAANLAAAAGHSAAGDVGQGAGHAGQDGGASVHAAVVEVDGVNLEMAVKKTDGPDPDSDPDPTDHRSPAARRRSVPMKTLPPV